MTDDAIDPVLAALNDPTRRAILERLAHGEATVTDVAAPFSISLPAISRHIKLLEQAGLIRRTRRGREHVLSLDARPILTVARYARQYERFWSERLDRLERRFAPHPEKS